MFKSCGLIEASLLARNKLFPTERSSECIAGHTCSSSFSKFSRDANQDSARQTSSRCQHPSYQVSRLLRLLVRITHFGSPDPHIRTAMLQCGSATMPLLF